MTLTENNVWEIIDDEISKVILDNESITSGKSLGYSGFIDISYARIENHILKKTAHGAGVLTMTLSIKLTPPTLRFVIRELIEELREMAA